jgi:hypothetical protein
MHPKTSYQLAKLAIADDLAWAERQRRTRLSRPYPAPDAIAFDARIEYLSFAARLRVLLGSFRPRGGASGQPAGA